MTTAQTGNTVRVHYTGKLIDGTTFDSSEGRQPLEFQLGSGMVIAGFDSGITGMQIGEKKSVHIPLQDAYGEADQSLILTFPRNEIPADIPLEIGLQLNMHDNTGQAIPVTITMLTDAEITVDANHVLAGKDLIFDIELVEIS